MPRVHRTSTGTPGQPAYVPKGVPYGQGEELAALQRAMPTPNTQGGPTAPAVAAEPPQPQPQPPVDPMAIAAAMPSNDGLLTAPDDQPDLPVTAGLPVGPGAGPSVLAYTQQSPINQTLVRLTESTGDSYFADLARRFRV